MASNVIPFSQALSSPVEFALAYAKLGWHVFPAFWVDETGQCSCANAECKNPGKHPIGWLAKRGQDDATTDETRISTWWASAPQANVAIMLAPSGLVAIDIDPRNGGWDTIDDLEAKHGAINSDVVQLTGGGGEHRLFSMAADLSAGLPGKLGAGVDVKRNGYIIAEPSNHASGRQYQWEASSNPLEGIVPSPLPDWLRGSFTNSSQTIVLPDSAVLALLDNDRLDLLSALQVIPSDDRDDWTQVGMALHSTQAGSEAFALWDAWSQTSTKYDPIDCTRVWRSFRNRGLSGITKATIFKMAKDADPTWINPVHVVDLPTPIALDTIEIARPVEITAPANLLNPPGILGDVARWIDATSIKPQPQFALQAAIAFMATVLGRRYVSANRNWPVLYLLNIGKSSSGKEHAKHAIEDALEQCDLGHLIGPSSYTSDSAVVSALLSQPAHLTVIDEFGKELEKASMKGNGRAQSMLKALMEVWGRCHGTVRPQGYSTFGMTESDTAKLKERIVRNPSLNLLAMTTPESFFESIGSAAARDGFLNRFLIVESDIGRQTSRQAHTVSFPPSVIEWVAAVRDSSGMLINPDTNATLQTTPKIIGISQAAQKAFDAFERDCIAQMDAYEECGLAEMFGRTREIAMRLALIVAIGCGARAIEGHHATWSIEYAGHYAKKTAERLKTSVADSEFEAVKKQVMALILKSGERGLTVRDLSKSSRKFDQIDKRGQENVLASLAYVGDIALVSINQENGRKRQVWVAVDHGADNSSVSPQEIPPDER
jgi:hypothetical protein